MKEILKIKLPILSRDSDYLSNIKYSSIINFFIHAAWQHAKELGLGYDYLSEKGMAWVLSKFRIDFYDIPKWPGDIEIETWPKGLNRLFYMRDSFVYFEGEKCAAISSDWLIINKEFKRPKLYDKGSEIMNINLNKHAIDELTPKLIFDNFESQSFNFKVNYNDLDVNNHLTTVRYIEFIFDAYEKYFFETKKLKSMTVNFIKEIPYKSKIELYKLEKSNQHQIEIRIDNTVFFRALLLF